MKLLPRESGNGRPADRCLLWRARNAVTTDRMRTPSARVHWLDVLVRLTSATECRCVYLKTLLICPQVMFWVTIAPGQSVAPCHVTRFDVCAAVSASC